MCKIRIEVRRRKEGRSRSRSERNGEGYMTIYSVFLSLLLIIILFCILSLIAIAYIPQQQQYAIATTTTTTTTTDTTTINTNFLTYENSGYRLTIQYPIDWDKHEIIPFMNEILGGSIVSFNPSSNINVDFHVFVYKPNSISSFSYSNITLSELVDREINDLRERYGFRSISSEPTTLANNPAYKIIYFGSNLESKTMETWTLKDDKAYEIEYTAVDSLDKNPNKETGILQFSHYLPTAQKMIDSFEFIK
jgi:hypothetical protein